MQDRLPDAGQRPPTFWLLLGILLATLAVYLPVFRNSFVNLDDYTYITSITPLSLANIRRVFTGYFEGYHPLSLLSLGLTYHLFELNPWPYHCTNVMLHLANTALVFAFIARLTGNRPESRGVALTTALLFGVHPVHVEAVAWVTSRKDVLYALFYLLALILYLRYLRTQNPADYAGTLLLALLSALSKGMAASLPLSLLAVDFLRGRSLRSIRAVADKVPFFALSAVFGVVSVISQQKSGYVPPTEQLGVSTARAGTACRALLLYLRNLFAPHKVTAFHPYPPSGSGSTGCLLAVVLMVAVLACVSRKSRPFTFGGLFFAANIVLVLQLVPVADFIIADRYNYMSSVGILFIAALTFGWTESRRGTLLWSGRIALALVSLTLGVLSFDQCRAWKNSTTMWSDVLAHYPRSVFALNMRGCAASAVGNHESASSDFTRAIEISPTYARSYINRGYARHRLGKLEGAESDYTRAIRLKPGDALPHNNRGLVRHAMGNHAGALTDYTTAIRMARDPRLILMFHSNRAIAHLLLGDAPAALADTDLVLRTNPDHYRALITRARARIVLGDIEGAAQDLHHAIEIAPDEDEPKQLRKKLRSKKPDISSPGQPSSS